VSTTQGFVGSLCVGPTGATPTGGEPCEGNDDCKVDFGFHCVDGACTLTCAVHEHCGTSGACTGAASDSEDTAVHVCEPDAFPRKEGQYGTRCPNGDECNRDDGFVCIGAGPGDADAYCAKVDCTADDECPAGFFCSVRFASGVPCTDVCGFPGRDGSTCIPDSDIGAGRPYQCSPVGLNRRVCLHRGFCNECDTDSDCLGKPNQICARDRSGQKICTRLCDPNLNSCPWGSAAGCAVWDDDLGVPTCSHRFGSCRGEGASCHPCVDSSDCPRGYCQETAFTGEHYCVDVSATCSCPSGTSGLCKGGGCPLTPEPAGLEMSCFGGSGLVEDPRFNTCIGASGSRSGGGEPDGCWPSL
jgi:hypothetical protein